jgi:hypothetical protein
VLPRPRRRAIHPLRRAVPAPGHPHRFWARGRPAPLLIAAPSGIEDYFHQINTASTDDQRRRIGEHYGIDVVPRMSRRTRACPTCLAAAQNDPIWTISVEIQHESASLPSGGCVRVG